MQLPDMFTPNGEFAENGKWWYPEGKPRFLRQHMGREISEALRIVLNTVYDNTCFVAGGFVRYMTSYSSTPAPYGDIDCFGREEEGIANLKRALDKEPFAKFAGESDWAYTYEWGEYKLNLIKAEQDDIYRTFGDPKDVVERFDLTVTLGWLERAEGVFVAFGDNRMPKHDLAREIHFNLIKHPSSSIRRISKYSAKGYRISTREIIRVMKVTMAYQEEVDDYLAWYQGDAMHTRTEIRHLYMSL